MKKTIPITPLFGSIIIFLVAGWHALSQELPWKPKPKRSDAVKVLVVTGGHDHDSDFYSVFDDESISAVVDPHPGAFSGDIRKRADVLVLYDMIKDLEVFPRGRGRMLRAPRNLPASTRSPRWRSSNRVSKTPRMVGRARPSHGD